MHTYKAAFKNGRTWTTVGADSAEEARRKITEANKGRPGGRHEIWNKWHHDSEIVTRPLETYLYDRARAGGTRRPPPL